MPLRSHAWSSTVQSTLPLTAQTPPVITGRTTLSRAWHQLEQYTLEYADARGQRCRVQREVCRRGDRAVALLIDRARRTVLLVRQFRLAAFINGHPDGMVIECPSGLIDGDDGDDALTAIRREIREETACEAGALVQLFAGYLSPGTIAERMHFFVGDYTAPPPTAGAVAAADADPRDGPIEAFELSLSEAWAMVDDGRIVDAKTVLLLYHARLIACSNQQPARGQASDPTLGPKRGPTPDTTPDLAPRQAPKPASTQAQGSAAHVR